MHILLNLTGYFSTFHFFFKHTVKEFKKIFFEIIFTKYLFIFVQGILEALEFLLENKYNFHRTFYIGFGHDEEVNLLLILKLSLR